MINSHIDCAKQVAPPLKPYRVMLVWKAEPRWWEYIFGIKNHNTIMYGRYRSRSHAGDAASRLRDGVFGEHYHVRIEGPDGPRVNWQ